MIKDFVRKVICLNSLEIVVKVLEVLKVLDEFSFKKKLVPQRCIGTSEANIWLIQELTDVLLLKFCENCF